MAAVELTQNVYSPEKKFITLNINYLTTANQKYSKL